MRARGAGTALALAAALAAAGCVGEVTGSYANAYGLRFAEVWTRFQQYYPLFAVKGVDWAAQRDRYDARARQLRSQEELAALVQELVAPLHDGNVWVLRPDSSALPSSALDDRPSNWDRATSQLYRARAGWHQVGSDWGWGRLGDVGYLVLESFNSRRVGARQVDAALDSLAGARALIIDVRMNGGGNSVVSDSIAGRFVDARRLFGYIQWRDNSNGGSGLSVRQPFYIDPRGNRYGRPVFLLTGRRSFNATEQFVLEMRAFASVTVMGEATGGSLSLPWGYDLGNGWSYTVPRFLVSTPENGTIEDAGIPPDDVVLAGAADFARGLDPVLDAALARAAALPAP